MDEPITLESRLNEPLHSTPFYYRPFCLLSAVFALTNTALLIFGNLPFPIALALWAIYAAFHFIRRKTLAIFLPWIVLAVLFSSFTVSYLYTEHRKPIKQLAAENSAMAEYENTEPTYKVSKIKAEVIDEHYCESFGSAYRVKLLTVDGKEAYGHATLECTEPLNAVPYDIIYCDGVFFNYDSGSGIRDRLYTMSNDIFALIEADTADVRYEDNSKLNRKAYELREKISFDLHRICDNSSAASFAMAVVFGARDGMDQALERDCSALGIIHLLAVSGSHFSALIAAIAFILRRTYVPGHIRQLYFAAFAIAFTILCGSTSAILRASIMAVFCMFVRFTGHRADPFIGLFFSLAAISVFRPYCVFDIGFLLSFFSTFGILLQIDRLIIPNKKEKTSINILNAIWGAFKITLAASLFSFPIIALAYGNISFIGLLINVIAGPIITLAMFVAIILMVTCNIPFIGDWTATVFELLYAVIQKGSNLLALHMGNAMQLRAPYVIYLILIPLCLFVLLRLLAINENLLTYIPLGVSIICLIVANSIHIATVNNTAELSLVSIKNNECIVLRSGTSGIICDFSDGTRSISEEALDTLTDDFYCVDIDGYMLTHYHVRHISTIGRILRNNYLRTVILPEPETEDERNIARALEQLSHRYGGKVIYYEIGAEFEIYGSKILAEKHAHYSSSHPTVAVRFSYGETSIAYLGAGFSESKATPDMLAPALDADTVIMGAHGPTQKKTEYYLHVHGQKIYVSPACTFLPRTENDIKLTADKNGKCKVFWKLEPST